MSDLSRFTQKELLTDLVESKADIAYCEIALGLGITELPSGGKVQMRLEINEGIVEIIKAELIRRGA